MPTQITRRTLMAAGASALAIGATHGAFAQAKPKMRFSCAFPETDLRAEGYKAFAAAVKDDLDFEPYWSNTLFKQGTELVALQRENLELCNVQLCVRGFLLVRHGLSQVASDGGLELMLSEIRDKLGRNTHNPSAERW